MGIAHSFLNMMAVVMSIPGVGCRVFGVEVGGKSAGRPGEGAAACPAPMAG